jgi:hypothetical protein
MLKKLVENFFHTYSFTEIFSEKPIKKPHDLEMKLENLLVNLIKWPIISAKKNP